jgi:hypothetical protein
MLRDAPRPCMHILVQEFESVRALVTKARHFGGSAARLLLYTVPVVLDHQRVAVL